MKNFLMGFVDVWRVLVFNKNTYRSWYPDRDSSFFVLGNYAGITTMMVMLIVSILLLLSLLFGCATPRIAHGGTDTDLNSLCENAPGYEYVCYSDEECHAYLEGYSQVIKERYMAQNRGWFLDTGLRQKVDVNLFYDHKGIYIIGYIIGTREGTRVWLQVTTWACDIEGNLIEPPGTLGGWSSWTIK